MFKEPSDIDVFLEDQQRPVEKSLVAFWPFLFRALIPYKKMVFLTLAVLFFAAFSTLAIGYSVRLLVDQGLGQGSTRLTQSLIILGCFVLGMSGASYGRLYLVSWVTERVVADLRKKLIGHLLTLDTVVFDALSSSEVSACLTTDITLIQLVFGNSLPIAVRNALLIMGGIGLLAWTSFSLTALLCVVIPIVLVPVIVCGKKVKTLSNQTQQQMGDLNQLIEETFSDMRCVHIFCKQNELEKKFNKKIDETVFSSMSRVKIRAFLTALVMTLVFFALSAVLWCGGKKIHAGELTAGQLSSFLFYALTVAGATGSLSEIYTDLQRAAGASYRFLQLFTYTPRIITGNVFFPASSKGHFSIKNLGFFYPARPDQWVLKKVNMEIASGEKIALVGPSGAGKSTLFSLLLRLYDPAEGEIFWNGLPLKQLDLENFRGSLGVVPQEPLLFHGTVLENIRFGNPGIKDEDILKSGEILEICDFIRGFPEGFQTIVGVRGVRLSGGQKQRIALARVLIRSPRVLLLDEATSALDAESEQTIQKALKQSFKGCTTIVIAHRFSTLKTMDRIFVFDKGCVVASGSHQDLLQKNALYARLAQLQFLDVEPAE